MEPPGSEPREATAKPAATAAADPPQEPPGTRLVPGIAHRIKGGILVGGAHGELIAVELAQAEERPQLLGAPSLVAS